MEDGDVEEVAPTSELKAFAFRRTRFVVEAALFVPFAGAAAEPFPFVFWD